MSDAKKGDWVQIHEIVLKPEERTGKLPEDTKKVPLELWVKGFLNHDANLNDMVEITTLTGRIVKGELVSVNPRYEYGFGEEYVPEILKIGRQLRGILKGGDNK
ncbi:2-amino-4-ketopentanoate thiolase alpha subunit [Caloramator quimbayensis]|uniref:2-amino-4-ketopentanoate thiolase alpha subunit n=1 Tax=Caloramator quimbayensis TaxID=1147123 RepID=A0A1T4WW05_9CLOT|nr:2-amino-4-oxopentanoate thiolase subunit OrtA [Caloramator quimbayensis]SKA81550.1 2-amino-4-ketopentanoate thiolase alpha subunit [Caloramator quimbayensis]